MENAADALKMAAAILIFIIAIASSFSLFGTAKQTADSIIGMRDKQAYLNAAELDNGILYTSSTSIKGDETETDITKEYVAGVTKNGDRVVKVDDVISTIYRYSKEKYGVTIVESSGTVIARFDSNTESIMAQYNIIESGLKEYIEKLNNNTKNSYITNNMYTYYSKTSNTLLTIYGNSGAPWYGNDKEIQRRINYDISGGTYVYNERTYEGKGLLEKLTGKKIIEVTNEIDQSKYLSDTNEAGEKVETNLLQQYQMPTVEIIYIVYNK